ncbi:MAG TPA: hypothetical protein VG184_02930 [Acidimicrobiales bacterium]|jgi:hypothetical protein|nr:hypothetical protein [Acidimicrobiales bacterium]
MNGPLLSRRQLQDALERLAHHLDRRGVHAELYLFGGRAMVLAHNARDATMDLDTAIRQHHGPVMAEPRVVATELGLPSWWLNEQATSYLPTGPDLDARTVLDRPGLAVIAASPRHLLAMKVRAARQGDIADIIFMARLVGASCAEETGIIAAQVFGDESLSERSLAVLADLDDVLHRS